MAALDRLRCAFADRSHAGQRRRRGRLFEIGGYKGKTTILLGLLARGGLRRLLFATRFDSRLVQDENRRESQHFYPGLDVEFLLIALVFSLVDRIYI